MILVTGGAGYIGSHMARMLVEDGHEVVTVDNLSAGHRDAVAGEFVKGDIGDTQVLDRLFASWPITAVMHFAAFSQVGESTRKPSDYYMNNVSSTFALLDAMAKYSVHKFIFSSSAAVFGEAESILSESHPKNPISPYGKSKLIIEQSLPDYAKAYDIHYTILRYFNAAGCAYGLGERHSPETHLIPLAVSAAIHDLELTVYGRDYPTADGTCIRDYVHVDDICRAHLMALEDKESNDYNLGNGDGFSVQEIITSTERVTGKRVRTAEGKRRQRDPALLIADSAKARLNLGWIPEHTDIDAIIHSVWEYQNAHDFIHASD